MMTLKLVNYTKMVVARTNNHLLRKDINQKLYSKRYSSSFNWNPSNGIESSYTPPSSWYTDNRFYSNTEKQYTFGSNWLCVGRKDQISKTGDYLAGTIVDEPFVIVNNGNGSIKAFSNVCRHHAALLCDDETSGQLSPGPTPAHPFRLNCPYHGWQYSTSTGGLIKAVKMKGCKDFSASKTILPEYDVDIVGPWIFLKLNLKAKSNSSLKAGLFTDQPDVAEYFSLLENSGYNVDMVHLTQRKYHIKCNWKVFIDNYLDGGYHVPVAHPELSSSLDMSSYTRQRSQNYFIQTCKSKVDNSEGKLNRVRAENGLPAYYVFHYPNLCINRYGDWLDTNIVWPINENECVVLFDWFVHKSLASNTNLIEESLAESHRVQLEDIMLSERVHKGLKSAAYDVGRYAPEFEDGEYFFHQRLQSDYSLSQS